MDLSTETLQAQKSAERLFAACAFVSPDYVREECGWLNPEIIQDERVRKLWTAIKAGDEPINAAMNIGMMNDVLQWVDYNPTSLAAKTYAGQISQRAYITRMAAALPRLISAIQGGDSGAAFNLLKDMSDDRPGMSINLPTSYDASEELEAFIANGQEMIATGIPKLDNNTGGLERRTQSVLAAATSVGKTALAWQIARNVAGPMGMRVIYFSLEMSRRALWMRAVCAEAGVTMMDVKAGKLSDRQKQEMYLSNNRLVERYEDRLMILDDSQTTDSIWQTVASQRPDLVIVDHLRFIKDTNISETKRLGQITERLHDMSKSLNCHVMTLAQLNRNYDSRPDKRPVLTDLRDSGEIEENADQVFMLYRDDVYNPPAKPTRLSPSELWIRKFRDGVRNALVNLMFDTEKQWFDNVKEIA